MPSPLQKARPNLIYIHHDLRLPPKTNTGFGNFRRLWRASTRRNNQPKFRNQATRSSGQFRWDSSCQLDGDGQRQDQSSSRKHGKGQPTQADNPRNAIVAGPNSFQYSKSAYMGILLNAMSPVEADIDTVELLPLKRNVHRYPLFDGSIFVSFRDRFCSDAFEQGPKRRPIWPQGLNSETHIGRPA